MRLSALRSLTTVLLALAPLSALGSITSVSYLGPGGTGTDGLTSGNLTEPRLTYTSIDYIDVSVTVDAIGLYDVNEAPGAGFVHNTTGQTWTGFTLTNLTPGIGSFDTDWFDGATKFPAPTSSATLLTFAGGTGVADTTFFAPFGHFNVTSTGTFTLRETPIVVPEPASIVLLGAGGVMGLGLLKRRRAVGG